MRYSPNALLKRAQALGFVVSQWSPGDRHGTRYQVFDWASAHGALYGDCGTYCGAREFAAFLRGAEAQAEHKANVTRFSSRA